MKLVSIYNIWGDYDILKLSVENVGPCVDLIIIVYSLKSNYGEMYDHPEVTFKTTTPIIFKQVEPNLNLDPRTNETNKRNAGLDLARQHNCTHFITMDADEFYDPADIAIGKLYFRDKNLRGIVSSVLVYFGSFKLCCPDTTLVPFIHELTPSIRHDFNRNYPFAWIDGKIRIDPTRSLTINSGVKLMENIVMHHLSWVRKDEAEYGRKIRNSTARDNIKRSDILTELRQVKEGYFCKFYNRPLERSKAQFVPDAWISNTPS